jgi:hypothetical protein
MVARFIFFAQLIDRWLLRQPDVWEMLFLCLPAVNGANLSTEQIATKGLLAVITFKYFYAIECWSPNSSKAPTA